MRPSQKSPAAGPRPGKPTSGTPRAASARESGPRISAPSLMDRGKRFRPGKDSAQAEGLRQTARSEPGKRLPAHAPGTVHETRPWEPPRSTKPGAIPGTRPRNQPRPPAPESAATPGTVHGTGRGARTRPRNRRTRSRSSGRLSESRPGAPAPSPGGPNSHRPAPGSIRPASVQRRGIDAGRRKKIPQKKRRRTERAYSVRADGQTTSRPRRPWLRLPERGLRRPWHGPRRP